MADSDEKNKYVEEYSHTTEAMNYILVAANCPTKFRGYIDALVGIANGNFKFEATDKEVNERGIGANSKPGMKYNSDWARDKRRDLIEWQNDGNLKLFNYEVQKFDKINASRPKSIYRLHLLKYAEQVLNEARKDESSWTTNRTRVIEQKAQKLVDKLRPNQKIIKGGGVNKHPPSEVAGKLKTAKSNIKTATQILKKWGNFKLHRDNEKLINEIEKLLAEIKARGFIDDPLDEYIFDFSNEGNSEEGGGG